MATIQKTTLKRYNGTDWDPVYLANSADISYLGKAITVAKAAGTGYTEGQVLAATQPVSEVLESLINNMAKMELDTIPGISAGDSITSLDVSKLKGEISRTNLPADVGGKGKEVASEEEKNGLTASDVNIGDIVKVAGGKVYLVSAVDPAVTYMELTDAASEIAWARLTGTPTTLAGYGITDGVNKNEKVTEATVANAGKILVLNAEGKLDVSVTGDAATVGGKEISYFATKAEHDATAAQVATNKTNIEGLQADIKAIDATWITKGTIDIERLPAASLERLKIVPDEAGRQALTKEQVQNGDSVKVLKGADSGAHMYFVIDETKLGTADWANAFTEYSAGTASAVDWSGITNKPTTVAESGLTDAVATGDLVEVAAGNAGKILKINAAGKLDADITGDAATLGGEQPAFYAKQSDMTAAQGNITKNAEDIAALKTAVGSGAEGLATKVENLQTDMTQAKADIVNLKSGEAVTALAAAKITGVMTRAQLPADISGRLITKATLEEAKGSLTAETASVGDLVKLADSKVYVVTDASQLSADAGYTLLVDPNAAAVAWDAIVGKPTSLAAMNFADAVTTAMLVDSAKTVPGNVGKILKINAAGKLDADITGDAATLGTHAADYFATKAEHDAVDARVTTAEGEIDTLQTEIKAIDAAWITTGKIDIARLPAGALERCVVVADDDARFKLTTASVQTGDTVKVTSTSKMYFVVDDAKLATEEGYEVYTAGTATAVDWAGVQNKPKTLAGYGITDAVNANEKVDVANAGNAGKILVLNADGKLDVDITGAADFTKLINAPTSSASQIDAAVATATHANRDVLDKLSVVDGVLAYDGAKLATKAQLDEVSLGALKVVTKLPADAANGQLVLEKIS